MATRSLSKHTLFCMLAMQMATACSSALASEAGQQFKVTDLGVGFATGLNNQGQVVGYEATITYYQMSVGYATSESGTRGFLADAATGNRQYLPTLSGFDFTRPLGINNAGQIAGVLGGSSSAPSAFMYGMADGQLSVLGSLGGNQLMVTGMTDTGYVTGRATDAQGFTQVFLKRPDAQGLQAIDMIAGDPPGYVLDTLMSPRVNAAGQIAATYHYYVSPVTQLTAADGRDPQSVTWAGPPYAGFSAYFDVKGIADDGTMAGNFCSSGYCFGMLRTSDGRANSIGGITYGITNNGLIFRTAINDETGFGVVVDRVAGGDLEREFFWTPSGGALPGSMPSGRPYLAAFNDLGDFVVNGADGHMYLVSQVPEPATWLTLLGGLGLIAGLAGRRQHAVNAMPAMCA